MTTHASAIHEPWPTLYKYRAFNRDAISILIDHELYFASPRQLNDPHDCQIDVAAALNEALLHFNLREATPDRRSILTRAIAELHRQPSSAKEIQEMVDCQSVCSFSVLEDNALLWAHYADAHRGFCAGFNPISIRERVQGGDNIYPKYVKYTDGNPFIPVLQTFANAPAASHSPAKGPSTTSLYLLIALTAVGTKSLAWSYEKEFRFVRVEGGSGCVRFPPAALEEVVLGCNMAGRDRTTLLNLLKAPEWRHVRLREVRKSPTSFSFAVVDL